NKIHSNVGGYLKSLIEKEALLTTTYEKRVKQDLESQSKKIEQEKALLKSISNEYHEYRRLKIDELMDEFSDSDKQKYFQSRNSIEKTMLYDEQGNLKLSIANRLLRGYVAKQNGLEDNEEAFKKWVSENKGIEIAQEMREGNLEWVIVNEKMHLK
ncbi:MAG: hypothetical protein SFU25_08980, partial [Candidatus Caenarcaniphilales bacterium]|nr:hypothetical protein [Candidatus Caenarcaniphilales bacterium]